MELRAELAEMMAEIEWNWLIPHAQRNALVIGYPGSKSAGCRGGDRQ